VSLPALLGRGLMLFEYLLCRGKIENNVVNRLLSAFMDINT
jgi:hypothetical protein